MIIHNHTNTDILLCIAVDVSGSMKESIGQETCKSSSRFEAVQRSLHALSTQARSKIQERRQQGHYVRFDVFAYAFGLNTITHCDLFALLEIGKRTLVDETATVNLPSERAEPYDDIIDILHHFGVNDLHNYRQWAGEILTPSEAERLRIRLRRYPTIARSLANILPRNFSEVEQRVKDNAKVGAVLGGGLFAVAVVLTGGLAALLAAGVGAAAGGVAGQKHGIAAELKKLARPEALAHELAAADDKQIIQILIREGKPQLLKKLTDEGEKTIAFESLETLLDEQEAPFDAMEPLLYGNTPMVTILGAIKHRFARELAVRPGATPIVFILSDGQSTDGDPRGIAEMLKRDGVHLVSCYVTSENIARPRALYNSEQFTWNDEAKLMFAIASEIDSVSAFQGFFRELGWDVPQHARSFVRINHPQVLDEFIRIILCPLDA